jgi:cobyric acid synthase CobQ/L-threonine-O-3-phosphate decarboxylase
MTDFPHGGHIDRLAAEAGINPEDILDFSANINPLGPPEWLRSVVSSALERLVHYPDPHCAALRTAVAERYAVPPETVIVGAGSSELIYLLPRALDLSEAVIPAPSYSDYLTACEAAKVKTRVIVSREEDEFAIDLERLEVSLRGGELVFLASPNNPTGLLLDDARLRRLMRDRPRTVFVMDEAFSDFVEGAGSLIRDRPPNCAVLVSMTKIFAVPGLRLGFAVADPELIRRIERLRPWWSVNSLAQEVGVAALRDAEYVERTKQFVSLERRRLSGALRGFPRLKVFPGHANFILARVDKPFFDAQDLRDALLRQGIAIRLCGNFHGLDARYFRVAVRAKEENDVLIEAMGRILGASAKPRKRRVPAIMIQGTCSNAGKSVLTAALCRIMLQDGFRPAPFKAQNMSLNSFVTNTGGEMGRAQVTQAAACRLDPDVRMNPVLLKPNSDTGSQVIVMGKPAASMDTVAYTAFKVELFQTVKDAYDSLASEHDVMVIEGAGSPAEINLKSHDIVNMRMAQYAGAPVLLAGDIDRGGVFASFVGTMELLSEDERRIVKGFLINKFRGDASLLTPALEYTLRHTGRSVLGVVPFIHDLGLPDEDSVSFKSGVYDRDATLAKEVDIVVVDLPHISNFTDFDALKQEPDVRVRIVTRVEDVGIPDAIILPGSKNVVGDLAYLRSKGFDAKLRELTIAEKTEIVGVCGGFQMLGRRIADPFGLESGVGEVHALGLLDCETVLAQEKTLSRVRGVHIGSGRTVFGYEIHHGLTAVENCAPAIRLEHGVHDGARSPNGLVWGAYMHGIFDADEFRRAFIDGLRKRRGLPPLEAVQVRWDIEPALERLADTVRRSVDMDAIYRITGLR